MRLLLPLLAAVGLGTVLVVSPQALTLNGASAQQGNLPPANPNCQPFGDAVPAGVEVPVPSDEPSLPIWCYPLSAPTETYVEGANDWVDTYDNDGPALQRIDTDEYNVFPDTSGGRIAVGTFVNGDHWAFDIGDASPYRLSGGAQLSPNRSFRFENGRFVFEGDIAAGSSALGGADSFSEMDLSPAPRPTGIVTDELYGYGQFGGPGALGCRFERDADGPHIICAMYDNTGRTVGAGGRLWETQGVGTSATAASVRGGYPQWPIPGTNLHVSDVWRMCAANGSYENCLDRFRMEITKDSIHILVNGYPVMFIDGLFAVNPATGRDNRIPDSWLGPNGVYPYYTSWINGGIHHATRFYWDRIAVMPHDASGNIAPPSASPTFHGPVPPPTATPILGSVGNGLSTPTATPAGLSKSTPSPTLTATAIATATATATKTAVATATKTKTPVPTATPTPAPIIVAFDDLTNANRALTGQYPVGVIDWGTGAWWLSGKYGQMSGNSVSFNGAGPTSASFNFVTPRKLWSIDAFNGGTTSSTVTVACKDQLSKQVRLAPNQSATLVTGWTSACTTVTISSSNGWYTNFKNIKLK